MYGFPFFCYTISMAREEAINLGGNSHLNASLISARKDICQLRIPNTRLKPTSQYTQCSRHKFLLSVENSSNRTCPLKSAFATQLTRLYCPFHIVPNVRIEKLGRLSSFLQLEQFAHFFTRWINHFSW